MFTTILTDRVNFARDIKDVRQQWLDDLLFYIGIDVQEMADMPRDIAVEHLVENDLEIIEYFGIDALEVRLEGETIGEWAGPILTLKEDEDKSLYFEATVENWSIIEEEIEENNDLYE
jgi:hypothetical protein